MGHPLLGTVLRIAVAATLKIGVVDVGTTLAETMMDVLVGIAGTRTGTTTAIKSGIAVIMTTAEMAEAETEDTKDEIVIAMTGLTIGIGEEAMRTTEETTAAAAEVTGGTRIATTGSTTGTDKEASMATKTAVIATGMTTGSTIEGETMEGEKLTTAIPGLPIPGLPNGSPQPTKETTTVIRMATRTTAIHLTTEVLSLNTQETKT